MEDAGGQRLGEADDPADGTDPSPPPANMSGSVTAASAGAEVAGAPQDGSPKARAAENLGFARPPPSEDASARAPPGEISSDDNNPIARLVGRRDEALAAAAAQAEETENGGEGGGEFPTEKPQNNSQFSNRDKKLFGGPTKTTNATASSDISTNATRGTHYPTINLRG